MNPARIIVLVIAAIAALGVAFLVRNMTAGAPQGETVKTAEQAPKTTINVLVARKDIAIGKRVTPDDMGWQEWPQEALNPAFLTQEKQPKALESFAGAVARVNLAKGEPVTGRKLVNPGEAGFMAAVLAPGMRAVSFPISVETGAGGFILPNDRVDILLTEEIEVRDGGEMKGSHDARTILENVRVLAIDQSYKQGKDEQIVIGSTATVELNRKDAELLAFAEASGNLSLALRSVADARPGGDDGARSHATARQKQHHQVSFLRYGRSSRLAMKDNEE